MSSAEGKLYIYNVLAKRQIHVTCEEGSHHFLITHQAEFGSAVGIKYDWANNENPCLFHKCI